MMRRIEEKTGEDIKTTLVRMYVEEEKNSYDIAEELGLISNTTVINWLRKFCFHVRQIDDPKMSVIQKLEYFPVQLKQFIEDCDRKRLTDSVIGGMLHTDSATIKFIRKDLRIGEQKQESPPGVSVKSLLFIII